MCACGRPSLRDRCAVCRAAHRRDYQRRRYEAHVAQVIAAQVDAALRRIRLERRVA